jgi:hypothetical protein
MPDAAGRAVSGLSDCVIRVAAHAPGIGQEPRKSRKIQHIKSPTHMIPGGMALSIIVPLVPYAPEVFP